ncbi:MAG: aldehyde dehydrogenase family protein [Elusimicrobia bacterium]|nr:aldehyde dehydrogenase family protein [Elusimicrobiota bacterium]
MAELARFELTDAASASAVAARCAAAASKVAALSSSARAAILRKTAEKMEAQAAEFAALICEEVKKPLKEARREAARGAFTVRWAGEEARRIGGEVLPLDLDAGFEGRWAVVKRVPRGPALFITPFNFPLNLVAHKVAPAVAAGLPFVLKPDPRCPKTAEKLVSLLVEAGWPCEAAIVVSGPLPAAEALVRDERFRVFSFTGSTAVGWKLKSLAVKAHSCLELGGNAAVFVAADADLAWAAARCAWGAFYYSGQVCISVQRIFVEKSVHSEFRKLLVENIKCLVVGDPKDEKTDIGPLIDEKSALRVEEWLKEAVAQGAKLWTGGPRNGLTIPPSVLEGVPADCKLSCEEAFGPVATLDAVASREEALERMNASKYGLQAGIFTNDLAFVQRAYQLLEVGGLIVNDIPSFRSDAMPYGGMKDSGEGREGVRYAIEDFTEPKTLVMKSI